MGIFYDLPGRIKSETLARQEKISYFFEDPLFWDSADVLLRATEMGKTWMSLNWVANLAEEKHETGKFNLSPSNLPGVSTSGDEGPGVCNRRISIFQAVPVPQAKNCLS
jgi:hypothetical protein